MVTDISKGRDSTVPVFVGLSTDTKPADVDNGSEFREFDTGKLYYFDAENVEWCEQPGEGGGGGGGGGDFSTAEIAIANTSGSFVTARLPYCNEEYGIDVSDIYTDYSATVKVPLYKNKASIFIDTTGVTVTVSGDITDDGEGYYSVTGDCTITIT